MRKRTGILSFFLLPALLSCAKVGDPLPPLVQIPPAIENIRLVQIGPDRVSLVFSTPPETEVSSLEVYRYCDQAEPADAKPLMEIPLEDLEEFGDPDHLVLEDPNPQTSRECRYELLALNRQGQRSPPAKTEVTQKTQTAGPPTRVRVQVEEEAVIVSWDAPEIPPDGPAIEGYLVNSRHVVRETTFRDTQFLFGEPRSYMIQAIFKMQGPTILSTPSESVTVVPEDSFPPAAPANPTAVVAGNRVQLLWDESSAKDIQSYIVYRSSDGVRFVRISPTEGLITNRFLDTDPEVGVVNYYEITSVDKSGNESPRSERVSAKLETSGGNP